MFADPINVAIPDFIQETAAIDDGRVRSWERGTRPPPEIINLLDNWMIEYGVPEIPGPLASTPFRIYGQNIPYPNFLKETEEKYSGTYICFYNQRQISGEKVIFARKYILDKVDRDDTSLYGGFLATFNLEKEQPPSRDVGTIKFFFSPISNYSNLAYIIELNEVQDLPPVSGIVRAGLVGSDAYFFGILSKFRSPMLGTIMAVRCLILKEDKIFSPSLQASKLSKDMFTSETWCLLKYYFYGIAPNKDDDCPSCLHAPNEFCVICDDNSYQPGSVEDLVKQLYTGSREPLKMAKDNVSISSLHDELEEIRKKL